MIKSLGDTNLLLNEIQDNKNLTPAMRQYVELKLVHSDALLFFRMGDFYELFFDDAITASQELNITLTKRGKLDEKAIPMCGIPYHSADNYLPRLIKKGFSVAICEQVETPEEMKIKGLKGPLKREVIRVITPGTVIEEHLLDSKSFNFLGCMFLKNKVLGVSWLDISAGVFRTNYFHTDNDFDLRYKIFNILSKLAFSELLILDENIKIFIPKEYKSILKPLTKDHFNFEQNYKKLRLFFNEKKSIYFEKFHNIQIITSGVLLNYLENSFFENLPKLSDLEIEKNESYMQIDNSSLKSLEIIYKTSGEHKGSLLNIIDKTCTASGSRLLMQRIKAPSCIKSEIDRRLDLAENFLKNKEIILIIKSILNEIFDVERSMSRLSLPNPSPKDLLLIAKSLEASFKIYLKIKSIFKKKDNDLEKKIKSLKLDREIVSEILNAIKENCPKNINDGNFINDGYNKNLDALRSIKKNASNNILGLQEKYSKETSINSLKIKFNKVLGYHVEVRTIHLGKIKLDNKFIHRQTTAQASRYTTNDLLKIEKDLIECEVNTLVKEKDIFEILKNKILKLRNEIFFAMNVIAEIDIAIMTADQNLKLNYTRPIILDNLEFNVEKGRHPVLESLNNTNHDFIPNNCNLSEEKNVWLITGPNMAGKSTFLRQNALLAIMAQAGLFIPAKNAKIGIIDKIFSRIGASDDLSRGHSTFMVEMMETVSILNKSTKKSFLIFDEIGRGTATFDGLAIAWAVLEHLVKEIQSRVLFATHYHELTTLQKKINKIVNHKMLIKEWNDNIIFLYKVVKGEADKSYGVEVAKLAGFPKQITDRAIELLEKLETKSGKEFKKINDAKNLKKNNILNEALSQVNPDNLTPLEALDFIYKLKSMKKD